MPGIAYVCNYTKYCVFYFMTDLDFLFHLQAVLQATTDHVMVIVLWVLSAQMVKVNSIRSFLFYY